MQNNTFPALFVGQNIVRLLCVDSTNDYLKKELANSTPLPEGTVILADEQKAGRGQQNNIWYSEPGKNLTLSLLLKPTFLLISQQFVLNKAISLAINEVFRTIIGNGVRIKWPNDIYVKNQKIGGVLIENILQGNTWKHAIIGIGLNINQEIFPPEAKNATSLIKILHARYDLEILLAQLCSSIEAWYLKLRTDKIKDIGDAYINQLYRFREEAFYKVDKTVFKAKIVGVDASGLLQLNDGVNTNSYNIKEIEFLESV